MMRFSWVWMLIGTAVAGLGVFLLSGCQPQSDIESGGGSGSVDVAQALGGDPDPRYARALEVREFVFPEDYGPHPEFLNEWWYVTGNLDGPEGQRFGFQITFFRFALSPEEAPEESNWATHQGWMAHLGLTDVNADRHYAHERFSRGAAGLAGAHIDPFRVWLDDWQLISLADNDFPWALQAATDEMALQLRFLPLKDKVFQGEQGLSRKSEMPGNASYYFSMTRLATEGSVRIGEQTWAVSGLSWMDREWSTSVLGEGQIGWDWFSLQLADGQDVMVYELRREDGTVDPISKGLWVEAGRDAQHTVLSFDEYEITVLETWQSPSGALYPVAWRIVFPERGRELEVRAVRPNQEMNLSVRYWEGAVDVFEQGQAAGRGFVELTGY